MFKIGDKVVYPMHGAGIIEKIETQVILEEAREYYIIKIPVGDMEVMIPVDNGEAIGMRAVVNEEVLEEMLETLGESPSEMSDNWNKRYRANQSMMKSGDIFSVAEVVRNLMIADQEKGLSTGERKMLLNAKQILISEMILVKDISEKEADEMVRKAVFAKGDGEG